MEEKIGPSDKGERPREKAKGKDVTMAGAGDLLVDDLIDGGNHDIVGPLTAGGSAVQCSAVCV